MASKIGKIVFLRRAKLIDPEIPRSNLLFETHEVALTDVRENPEEFTIDVCGFQYLSHETSVCALLGLPAPGPTLSDVKSYKAETEALLKSFFDATHVVCYDFRIRENVAYYRSEIDLNDPLLREGPAKGAHTDVTVRSGPEMIRNRLEKEVLNQYHKPEYRFRIVNTWRPLNQICEENPLTLCDYRSVDPEDLLAADRVIPERAGEVYYILHNRRQRWCWLSDQTPRDLAVFLLYDNQKGNQARYCPHITFENPDCGKEAPPRRSVETRSIIISPMTGDQNSSE